VRQLQNAIERAEIMADGSRIRLGDLPPEIHPSPMDMQRNGDELADIERSHVLEILEREKGNKARTARSLGISRRSLYRLLEKYNVPET
jgi:transcriptional regulator of acetoin/glycerol metabolism